MTVADPAGAYFVGLQGQNEAWLATQFGQVLQHWFDWRRSRFPQDGACLSHPQSVDALTTEKLRLSEALRELCRAYEAETPTFTPRYIGHMKADISIPALLGWFVAMLHNPNTTSREASRVGSRIEQEAIEMLATMLGFAPEKAQGHFTSGGTVANFEAVWRARYRLDHWLSLGLYLSEQNGSRLDPFVAGHAGWEAFDALYAEHNLSDTLLKSCSAAIGNPVLTAQRIARAMGTDYYGPVILVPGNKHYSWRKAANVFGLGEQAFWSVALDADGRLDCDDLNARLTMARHAQRPVLMVVSVAGTTETGTLDPIDRVQACLDRWQAEFGFHIWHHVDAAYGGFFCSLIDRTDDAADSTALPLAQRAALRAIGRAQSVTIDPHKLGYVPYACGAFLTHDTVAYRTSAFEAPYLERKGPAENWAQTLEGSRAASGASATWLSGKSFEFTPHGLGAILSRTIQARQTLQARLEASTDVLHFLPAAETNILCFFVAPEGVALSEANRLTETLFETLVASPEVSVSKTRLGQEYDALIRRHVARYHGQHEPDVGLVLIRAVFMNPQWATQTDPEPVHQTLLTLIKDA
ncbi:MAG: pyridoxal phosphate-dependent decarboxylase family protein, partial [Asticcacaulis sp.]